MTWKRGGVGAFLSYFDKNSFIKLSLFSMYFSESLYNSLEQTDKTPESVITQYSA